MSRGPTQNGGEKTRPGQRFYGKYSGMVVDNIDLEGLYRVKVRVPTIPATLGGVWARPCVPYFGSGVGFFAIPPRGARVWVEFEAGNPNLPIWVGGFWDETQFLEAVEDDPDYPNVKIWQTEHCQFVMRDQDLLGEVLLKISDPAVPVPVEMKFYDEGVLVETGISSLRMNPVTGIVLSVGDDTILNMTPEGIQLTAPNINSTAEIEITAKAGGALRQSAGGEASLKAGAAVSVGAGADLDLEAGGVGTLKAVGDLNARGTEVQVEAGVGLDLGAEGLVSVRAGGDLTQNAGAAIQIDTSLNIEQSAATNVLNGEVEVDGLLTEDGDPVMVLP